MPEGMGVSFAVPVNLRSHQQIFSGNVVVLCVVFIFENVLIFEVVLIFDVVFISYVVFIF